MSVLSFPRIYFNGYMQWNVDTTNNNEMSAAKRLILEAWGGLINAGFPQQDLSPIAVPCGLS
ncbi:MAG TPA: hypothetical protein VNM67_07215 [Thermoanaerobaculia bacterium]|jgi:hypothetical protein|nr:hypothetical protein [Thermoanaerobaculia bacterium]